MTKRKRTPPPSPAPRQSAVFEVPFSLWRFQAITQELAQQSEALLQPTSTLPPQQSRHTEQPLAAPCFDAQAFKDNPLRFSPYSHQMVIPPQPWPENDRAGSSTATLNPNADVATSGGLLGAEGALQDSDGRRMSIQPDAQLFDELTNALQEGAAREAERGQDPHALSRYTVRDDQRITFNPHAPTDLVGTHTQPSYQHPLVQGQYPSVLSSPVLPSNRAPNIAHRPQRLRDSKTNSTENNTDPMSPQNPLVSPIDYSPKSPAPRPPPRRLTKANDPMTKPNVPGYYKSSLKTWSQERQDTGPPLFRSQATYPFAFSPESSSTLNTTYAQIPYSGNAVFQSPPQSLVLGPTADFSNHRGVR